MTNVGGTDVSRETMADLVAFADLVTKWTPRINLIARGSIDSLWDRHITDSVQLYRIAPQAFNIWVDLGSGGGFPGIVMAILAKSDNPEARFVLVESDQRKATFLRTAIRELSLNAKVLADRIEEVDPQGADVVSARALSALSSLLPLASRHVSSDGVALFPKGKKVRQEVADARQNWSFDLEDHPSITDPEARILSIRRIHAVVS